eukprot:gnl/TRDRNA2_/TRDRNA2_136944_c0_seq1.p1 gnl/TRDRNA2_/TRDRNA2_136944_c0~~gnl/TRDRNA2_/TRDRNA2_136944_c0_seq1.p1  ORF type:complete len:183 (+),score=22.02 gnl/TRDRNA2_/TRDRNA2_136944_c0_seq1:41-550(+)
MDGDTAIVNWAKCCDCETKPIKPAGKPCEVSITTAHKLKLKFTDSMWPHNVIQVPSKADFDTCKIPDGNPIGWTSKEVPGTQTMDETMEYTEAGTYYYACSVMCAENTGGASESQYCHCNAFSHKLIVTVSDAAGNSGSASAADAKTIRPTVIHTALLMTTWVGFSALA